MKCHICNKTLSNDEIKHEPHYGRGGFSPCTDCLEIIGELFNDSSEEEIDAELERELSFEGIQSVGDGVSEKS